VGRHVAALAREQGLSVAEAEGDLRDHGRAEAVVADAAPAAVVHLASTWGRHGADPWIAAADDVAMTGAVLRAVARHAPDAPVLAAGSAAQYGMGLDRPLREDDPPAPVSAYGVAKTALEAMFLAEPLRAGVRAIWARSFNHVGPGQGPSAPVPDWAAQVAAGGRVRAGRLDVVRDLLDVRDVAAAYLALVRHPEAAGVFNVCSGNAIALSDVMAALTAAAGATVEVEQDPALVRAADPPVVVGDNGRLRDLTGWAPVITLDQSLRDVLSEHRSAHDHDPRKIAS
jgi:GDP-4-dehydro-6-deoxy-D-mannose reductase